MPIFTVNIQGGLCGNSLNQEVNYHTTSQVPSPHHGCLVDVIPTELCQGIGYPKFLYACRNHSLNKTNCLFWHPILPSVSTRQYGSRIAPLRPTITGASTMVPVPPSCCRRENKDNAR